MTLLRILRCCALLSIAAFPGSARAQNVVAESYLHAAHEADAANDLVNAEQLYALALREAHDCGNLSLANAAIEGLGVCFAQAGDFERAAVAWRTRLRIEEEQAEPDAAAIHELLGRLAEAYSRLGRHVEAHALQLRLVSLLHERGDARLAEELNDLAAAKLALQDGDGAEAVARQALDLMTQEPGEEPLVIAECLDTLAQIKRAKGEFAAAEQMAAKAVELAQTQGDGATASLGRMLATLAAVQHASGKSDESETNFCKALELHEMARGRAHPDWRQTCERYAVLLKDLGRAREADALLVPLTNPVPDGSDAVPVPDETKNPD